MTRKTEKRERERRCICKEARERRGERGGIYIYTHTYIAGKERGQEADEVERVLRGCEHGDPAANLGGAYAA